MTATASTLFVCAFLQAGPAREAAAPDAKIRPLPANATFRLVVEKDPRLPKGDRPESTAPAGDGRLSVSIQPERKQFPANGPLAVDVTLKNTSEKAFSLFGLDQLGGKPDLVIVHLKTAGQVHQVGPAVDPKGSSVLLEPGKSVTRTVVVEYEPKFFAPPPFNPVPGPIPLPRAAQPAPAVDGKAPAIDAERRRPALIAAPVPVTIAPEGTVRLRLMLEFVAPPDNRPAQPHWTGKLASEAIDVELTAPVAVPPVVGPIVGPPMNRDQAIAVAHRAAEAALNAAYNPVDPVRPPHEGAWIAEPAKDASVKDRNGGGWTVSWTHTQKGKGFSYHAVIDVDASGATTVREVFGGYSNR